MSKFISLEKRYLYWMLQTAFFLAYLLNSSSTNADTVKAYIDETNTVVGKPVNLTITARVPITHSDIELSRRTNTELITRNAEINEKPDVSGLEIKLSGFKYDEEKDNNQNIKITKHIYTVTPKKAGDFIIPPFSVKFVLPNRYFSKLDPPVIKTNSLKLQARKIAVTFDSAGGTIVAPITATFNSPLGLPPPPTLEGYSFAGWVLNRNGKAFSSSTIVTETSDFTLYAKWKEKLPQLPYRDNIGQVNATVAIAENNKNKANIEEGIDDNIITYDDSSIKTSPNVQPKSKTASGDRAAPRKEALLIANGKYSHFAGLAHPSPDAAKLSAALEQLGFRVRVVRDGNREQMLEAISEFERGLRNTGAIAFFHYGGHGVQVDGKNYLLPADADIPDERRVATRAVALDEVMTAMDAAAARASIVVIDACRDNPLPAGSGRNLARGLSVVGMKPKNSIVIYAAEAGSKALDGLFTPILASSLQQKGRNINQIMMSVRSEVYAKSSGQQTPGEYNQLFEELFLGELAEGEIAPEAIFTATPTPYAAPTPASGVKADMVLVEGGTLPDASELAGQSVKSFYIGRTEVTWLEWKKVRGWASEHGYDIGNIGKGTADNHPAQMINWYDCIKWCNAKSEMEGLVPVYTLNGTTYKIGESVPKVNTESNGYRLPSEEEWEWAARGGVESHSYKYSGSDDLNAVGWVSDNSDARTHEVGKKQANELGVYDMTGNVWEWCFALNGANCRRIRGGGWDCSAFWCPVARGDGNGTLPSYRVAIVGFRLARSAVTPAPPPYAAPTPALPTEDDMVLVEGGTLPDASELAGKSVKSFYIGRTEVTWLEWKKVRGWASDHGYDIGNVGEGSGNDHPVRDVSWYDCVKWCNARSEMERLGPVYQVNGQVYKTGEFGPTGSDAVQIKNEAKGYRLPTDAEWEWAARGGKKSKGYTYSGSNDWETVAWTWLNNSPSGTKAVGTKKGNELQIYDMSGNVWEWCWDMVEVSNRRFRGGSWYNNGNIGLVSRRDNGSTYDSKRIGDRSNHHGFRVARSSGK